jgi:hypothetical protein
MPSLMPTPAGASSHMMQLIMTQSLVICPDCTQHVVDLGIVVGPARVVWFVPLPHIIGDHRLR